MKARKLNLPSALKIPTELLLPIHPAANLESRLLFARRAEKNNRHKRLGDTSLPPMDQCLESRVDANDFAFSTGKNFKPRERQLQLGARVLEPSVAALFARIDCSPRSNENWVNINFDSVSDRQTNDKSPKWRTAF